MQSRTPAKKDNFLKVAWRNEVTITEEQFQKIEAAGDIDLDTDARSSLTLALNENDFERQCYETGVTVKDIIESAGKMAQMAESMGRIFSCQTSLDKAIVLRLKYRSHWEKMCGLDGSKFAVLGYFLNEIIDDLSKTHYVKDGRDKDITLDNLFRRLDGIYTLAASKRVRKKRRDGGKSNFVEAILLAFPQASRFFLDRVTIAKRLSRRKTDETGVLMDKTGP